MSKFSLASRNSFSTSRISAALMNWVAMMLKYLFCRRFLILLTRISIWKQEYYCQEKKKDGTRPDCTREGMWLFVCHGCFARRTVKKMSIAVLVSRIRFFCRRSLASRWSLNAWRSNSIILSFVELLENTMSLIALIFQGHFHLDLLGPLGCQPNEGEKFSAHTPCSQAGCHCPPVRQCRMPAKSYCPVF